LEIKSALWVAALLLPQDKFILFGLFAEKKITAKNTTRMGMPK
jgi:hypothetical protein